MTIAERKERDAYDRENLWRQIATITDDMIGAIIELRNSYQGMSKDQGHRRYFRDLTDWYQIEPPEKLCRWALVIEWRSTGTRDRRQNGTRCQRRSKTRPSGGVKVGHLWRALETAVRA